MTISTVHSKSIKAVTGHNELRALISLMDDPDTYVQLKVSERLAELDENSVPVLDEIREEISDEAIRNRVTRLIHNITFPSLEQEFVEFLGNGLQTLRDLETGQLLLCRIDNPTLRTDLYRRQLDRIAARLESSMSTAMSPGDKLQRFTSFFFERELFKGCCNDYADPGHSFLHKVLQRRRGIPLSLGMVMLFVAGRLELPFYGVNMPLHFLLLYESDLEPVYIDPFNEGKVVSMDQCSQFLRNNSITPDPSHFRKATGCEMLARSIRNLILGFEQKKDDQYVLELKKMLGYVMQYGSTR